MRTSVYTIRITFVITIVALIIALLFTGGEGLAYDILIGIFGGSILTFILTLVNYKIERQKTLESFYLTVRGYIKELSKYEPFNHNIKYKAKFFLEYYNLVLPDLEKTFNDICFLLDYKKDKKYIEERIYLPTIRLNRKISNNYWNYKRYVDGKKEQEATVREAIEDIEKTLYAIYSGKIGVACEPKFIRNILSEIENPSRFYKIMNSDISKVHESENNNE